MYFFTLFVNAKNNRLFELIIFTYSIEILFFIYFRFFLLEYSFSCHNMAVLLIIRVYKHQIYEVQNRNEDFAYID